MKLLIFCRITASFKIFISKIQDFGNFELSPMVIATRVIDERFFLISPWQHLLWVLIGSMISFETFPMSATTTCHGDIRRVLSHMSCLGLVYINFEFALVTIKDLSMLEVAVV